MANYLSGAAIRSPIAGDASNPKFRRDQILDTDVNDGVRFLFDLGFPYSYPGGPIENRPAPGNPVNGATIYDVVDLEDGSFASSSTGTVFSGGGFDFSGVSDRFHEVRGPQSSLASIIPSSQQQFAIYFYVKLPTLADWYSGTGIIPLFCTNGNSQGYAGAPDLATIGFVSGGQLRAARSTTAVGTAETRTLTVPAGMAGRVTQILYYRTNGTTELRIKNSGGMVSSAAASGATTNLDLSACIPRWGICQALWDFSTKPSLATAKRWRLYRGFIENLLTSGRDPIAIADEDYRRVVNRNIFT